MNAKVTDFSWLNSGKRVAGANIPQHRLLSRLEWNRLRNGEIRQFTYWVTRGPYLDNGDDNQGRTLIPHLFSVTVHKEDAP